MIVRASDPLPPNSLQPYPAWLQNRHRARLAQISLAALRAKAQTLCAPDPMNYSDLGPQIMADVARAPQNELLTGQSALAPPPPSPTPAPISNAPTVVPLNMPADTSLLPTTSAPPGLPGATLQPGVPWGNSPITPPVAPTGLLANIPGWVWVGTAVLIGMSLSGPAKRRGF